MCLIKRLGKRKTLLPLGILGFKCKNNEAALEDIKQSLKMKENAIGGFYSEIYRASDVVQVYRPLAGGHVNRTASSAIYFLMEPGTGTILHKQKSDEILHHYMGGPVKIPIIHPDGQFEEKTCGREINNNQSPAVVIPANTWFATSAADDFSFLGATVAPGFDFRDVELANRTALLEQFPQHRDIIVKMTRD